METHQAHTALEAVRAQRRAAADRLVTPSWYHPLLGLLLGGFLAAQAAHSGPVYAVALLVFAIGTGWLASAYRRRTGLWVSGYRRGPAGRITALLLVSLVAVCLAAGALDYAAGQRWAFVAAGVVAAALIVVLGPRFDEALRAELRRS